MQKHSFSLGAVHYEDQDEQRRDGNDVPILKWHSYTSHTRRRLEEKRIGPDFTVTFYIKFKTPWAD